MENPTHNWDDLGVATILDSPHIEMAYLIPQVYTHNGYRTGKPMKSHKNCCVTLHLAVTSLGDDWLHLVRCDLVTFSISVFW